MQSGSDEKRKSSLGRWISHWRAIGNSAGKIQATIVSRADGKKQGRLQLGKQRGQCGRRSDRIFLEEKKNWIQASEKNSTACSVT